MRRRYYVLVRIPIARENTRHVISSAREPTAQTHPHCAYAVGPFRDRRAAEYFTTHPNCRTVTQANDATSGTGRQTCCQCDRPALAGFRKGQGLCPDHWRTANGWTNRRLTPEEKPPDGAGCRSVTARQGENRPAYAVPAGLCTVHVLFLFLESGTGSSTQYMISERIMVRTMR
jgi:hypothetical protein